jgi:hypothetical protein
MAREGDSGLPLVRYTPNDIGAGAARSGAVLSAKVERGPEPLKMARRTLRRLLAP